jgi:L-threonylcarbamoyladenylate synthase
MPGPKPQWIIVGPAGTDRSGRPPWARVLPGEAALEQAASVIARGGLVIIPTETFYGLAALATDAAALERVAVLKGREASKALPLIAGSREQVETVARLPQPLAALAERFWPGPLTLALPPTVALSPQLLAPAGTVGVRVSSHPLARALALRAGIITATSANLAGRSPSLAATAVDTAVTSATDLVLDAGPCPGGAASTILGLQGGKVVLYRAGAVATHLIADVVGYPVLEAAPDR